MNNQVETLIKDNNEMRQEIFSYEKLINEYKKQIKLNEKIIYKNCDHEWEYDSSCGPYDRIKYRCIKCDLWRNDYMYS